MKILIKSNYGPIHYYFAFKSLNDAILSALEIFRENNPKAEILSIWYKYPSDKQLTKFQ